ncbi:MAG: hypothetical protein WAL87_08175 [Chthoniobacterales bacterium]
MASPRLPSKLAKIWRKSRSQFQIAGIVNHAKTRAFAGLPGNGPKIYRTDVILAQRVATFAARFHDPKNLSCRYAKASKGWQTVGLGWN